MSSSADKNMPSTDKPVHTQPLVKWLSNRLNKVMRRFGLAVLSDLVSMWYLTGLRYGSIRYPLPTAGKHTVSQRVAGQELRSFPLIRYSCRLKTELRTFDVRKDSIWEPSIVLQIPILTGRCVCGFLKLVESWS